MRLYEWIKCKKQVLERDNYICQICLNKFNLLHVHHIIPKHRNGLDSLNNLTSVCSICHNIIEMRWNTKPIIYNEKESIRRSNMYLRNLRLNHI
jgi:5-methylcytosine-specific restriction enzyme A